MGETYVIRRVYPTLADAQILLAVERESLGDSNYTPEEALRVLARPEHHAYVATLDGEVVGFASCFETPCERGTRLEIDMLGVAAARRRRGLATRLILHSMREAEERGVRAFRAVVAEKNLASQRAFRCAGFVSSPSPLDMLIYEVGGTIPVGFLPPKWAWRT
ncbi:MAG: hypothetical protein A2Y73_00575, partial [Chloroflexi bacterium RBG_13_56_8]